ncbi:hypothetical protein V3C99_005640, partial [Haemonchus contortus]
MGHNVSQLQLRDRVCQHKRFRTSGRSLTSNIVALLNAGGLRHRTSEDNVDDDVTAELIDNYRHLPVSAETNRTATRADQIIKKIIDYIKSGN